MERIERPRTVRTPQAEAISAERNPRMASLYANDPLAEPEPFGPASQVRLRWLFPTLAGTAFVLLLPAWVLPSLILLIGATAFAAYLYFGEERIGEMARDRYARLERRHPAKAEALRRLAENSRKKAAEFARHLPQSWAERLAALGIEPPEHDIIEDRIDPMLDRRI